MTSVREMRAYLRSEAKRAKAFEDLESQLKEYGDLERAISVLATERDNAEKDVEAVQMQATLEKTESTRLLLQADDEAERMKEDAKNKQEDAEKCKAAAAQIMDDAKADASDILRQGNLAVDDLVKGRRGVLAQINESITEANDELESVLDAVNRLENHRDNVSKEIDALRRRLG